MNGKKLAFYLIWLGLLSLAPITVLKNTPISLVVSTPVMLTGTIQRLVGLWAFTLLFTQIVLGSFMQKWTEKLGGWVFGFHVFEGLVAYVLIVVHPISFLFFNYFLGKGFDPFNVFTQACVLCPSPTELYYTLGRAAFWLLTFGVLAALFRTSTPFLRLHWRKFHILNYLAFLLVGLHSLGVGTDIGTFPFSFFHAPAIAIVLLIVVFKGIPRLSRS